MYVCDISGVSNLKEHLQQKPTWLGQYECWNRSQLIGTEDLSSSWEDYYCIVWHLHQGKTVLTTLLWFLVLFRKHSFIIIIKFLRRKHLYFLLSLHVHISQQNKTAFKMSCSQIIWGTAWSIVITVITENIKWETKKEKEKTLTQLSATKYCKQNGGIFVSFCQAIYPLSQMIKSHTKGQEAREEHTKSDVKIQLQQWRKRKKRPTYCCSKISSPCFMVDRPVRLGVYSRGTGNEENNGKGYKQSFPWKKEIIKPHVSKGEHEIQTVLSFWL